MKKPDLSGGSQIAGAASNTGRHIVVMQQDAIEEGVRALEAAGLKVAVSKANSPDVLREDDAGDATAIVYATLGIALVESEPGAVAQLTNAASDPNSPIQSIRPELIANAINDSGFGYKEQSFTAPIAALSVAYLEGYRNAVTTFAENLMRSSNAALATAPANVAATWDESRATWGLQATRVSQSSLSGRGVRIAVLDTGLDLNHPDFEGRTIKTISFAPGVPTAQDGHGHGTHCIGTACGTFQQHLLPRYGVAHGAEIFVAKVLYDNGSGAEGSVVQGLEWAINNGCHIVSMSLQWLRNPGSPFNTETENMARRALELGVLPIAAAGNHSARPGFVNPVSGPADCPSVLSVAALNSLSPTSGFEVATFSNGGINPGGGQVDIAAPGVNVYSSYVMPTGHSRLNGTSMAAPHVAGIAALYAEANPGVRGRALWNLLTGNAKPLSLPRQDVGAGLVQAL